MSGRVFVSNMLHSKVSLASGNPYSSKGDADGDLAAVVAVLLVFPCLAFGLDAQKPSNDCW